LEVAVKVFKEVCLAVVGVLFLAAMLIGLNKGDVNLATFTFVTLAGVVGIAAVLGRIQGGNS